MGVLVQQLCFPSQRSATNKSTRRKVCQALGSGRYESISHILPLHVARQDGAFGQVGWHILQGTRIAVNAHFISVHGINATSQIPQHCRLSWTPCVEECQAVHNTLCVSPWLHDAASAYLSSLEVGSRPQPSTHRSAACCAIGVSTLHYVSSHNTHMRAMYLS